MKMCLAVYADSTETILELLVDHRTSPFRPSLLNLSPLEHAIISDKLEMVQYFCEKEYFYSPLGGYHGPNLPPPPAFSISNIVNRKNYKGNTPLHTACYYQRFEIFQYLLSKGAGIDHFNNVHRRTNRMSIDQRFLQLSSDVRYIDLSGVVDLNLELIASKFRDMDMMTKRLPFEFCVVYQDLKQSSFKSSDILSKYVGKDVVAFQSHDPLFNRHFYAFRTQLGHLCFLADKQNIAMFNKLRRYITEFNRTRSAEFEMFRDHHRHQLIDSDFNKLFNYEVYKRFGIIHEVFPLHDPTQQAEIRKNFNSELPLLLRPFRQYRQDKNQWPFSAVAYYYGLDYSFYFLWLSSYTSQLILLGIVSLVFIYFFFQFSDNDSPYMPIFSLVILCWAEVLLIRWKRTERASAYVWRTLEAGHNKIVRPNFRGNYRVEGAHNIFYRASPFITKVV